MFFTFYKCTWWVKITCTCSPSEVSFIKNKWTEQREGELVTAARKLGVQTRTAWPENLSPRGTDGMRCRYILLKALFRFPLTLCLCLGLTLLLISARNWGSAQQTLMNTLWSGIPQNERHYIEVHFLYCHMTEIFMCYRFLKCLFLVDFPAGRH